MCLECHLTNDTWDHKVGKLDLDIKDLYRVVFLEKFLIFIFISSLGKSFKLRVRAAWEYTSWQFRNRLNMKNKNIN